MLQTWGVGQLFSLVSSLSFSQQIFLNGGQGHLYLTKGFSQWHVRRTQFQLLREVTVFSKGASPNKKYAQSSPPPQSWANASRRLQNNNIISRKERHPERPELPAWLLDDEDDKDEVEQSTFGLEPLDVETSPAPSSLVSAAHLLQAHISRRAAPDMQALSNEVGVNYTELKKRLFAAGEALLENQANFGGKKVYTKGVFSSENSSASTGKKKGLVYTKKLVFKGKRRKIHIHQRAFKVVVGDPFAQYWCIDFGLL